MSSLREAAFTLIEVLLAMLLLGLLAAAVMPVLVDLHARAAHLEQRALWRQKLLHMDVPSDAEEQRIALPDDDDHLVRLRPLSRNLAPGDERPAVRWWRFEILSVLAGRQEPVVTLLRCGVVRDAP